MAAVALLAAFVCACAPMGLPGGGGEALLFPTKSIDEQNVSELPHALRLDVGIQEFDENYTREQAKELEVLPEVRKAEAKYFPLRLREAVDQTDYWANVWVVPEAAITDVKVHGTILESTGLKLRLKIVAVDASGKTRLKKTYTDEATEYDYSGGRQPFEGIFEDIAEDLKDAFMREAHADIRKVKNAADVRFAAWVAPVAFSEYISEDHRKVVGLPARNDEIYRQTLRLREYDMLFFDKLQDSYDEFHGEIEPPYKQWLKESYNEVKARDEARSEAITQGVLSGVVLALGIATAAATGNDGDKIKVERKSEDVVVASSNRGNSALASAGVIAAAAGGYGIYDAVGKYKRTKIHDEALRELGASVETELKPHSLEVEGKIIQLEGSIDEQYLQWHAVLQEQHRLGS